MPTHFPYLLDPTIHPDYARRSFKVPTWETFEHRTQFTTLRSLSGSTWRDDIRRHTEEFNLGRVIWPLAHVLHAPHVAEAIEEIRRRNLYLFDLWSYVPGSPMEGIWSNITPPPGMVRHLEEALGDRFLGIDNGEQDGRYVWATGQQQCPGVQGRLEQYLSFQRHFQKLCDELGNHMSALTSLTFGHYFLKEGNHCLLGAETAQALPNSQIYYAFIRGAGRQYGVHWFGNASVFNRWGWKSYGPEQRDGGYVSGPERGTSLSLLKRLLYTHYLYNCVAVGYESGWLLEPEAGVRAGWELTPIGRMQRGAVEFVARAGQPGVMHAPVALLLDFFAGWAPPRHLYTGNVYQVWGGMPYEAGDYLTHAVLSLLYPGYEDAGYYRDERGFLSATPFGDMAECLLSDAPLWVMQQYGLIIAAGALTPSPELHDKLRAFVSAGGHLMVTAANARGLLPGLDLGEASRMAAGAAVRWADGAGEAEEHAFELAPVRLPEGARVLAGCGGRPAVVRLAHGRGAVTLLLSPLGLNADPLCAGPVRNAEEAPLACPHVLVQHAGRALRDALAAEQPFEVGEGLGFVTCRRGPGDYVLGVHNNGLAARPLRIASRCGALQQVVELDLDQSEKGAVGYRPGGSEGNDGGRSDAQTIAGGDVRLFAVTVQENGVRCLPAPQPPPPPRDRLLALRPAGSVQDEILARPTFFQHFDGVKVDYAWLLARDRRQLERERGWLERQRVRMTVDFSRGLNLFPGLTLLNAYPPHFDEARADVDDVMEKMARCGARDAVLALHRKPENHWPNDRAHREFTAQVGDLCARAAQRGVRVHLQPHPARWAGKTEEMIDFIRGVGAPNLRLALNTGHAAMAGEDLRGAVQRGRDLLGAVLLCGARRDAFGQPYDAHEPVHRSGMDLSALAGLEGVLFILDGVYANHDDEYLDLLALKQA